MNPQKLIALKPNCRDHACCQDVRRLGGRVTKRIPFVGAVVARGLSPEALDVIASRADVLDIEDDVPIYAIGALPRTLEVGKAAGLQIPWGVRSVDAPSVWPKCQGEDVRVAVVDSGIDVDHPDLEDRIAGGYCAFAGSYDDENGHGTHVAGTIAATGAEGGVLGVAPRAELLSVKVLNARGSGSLSHLLEGLAWIAEQRVQIVNMSLGSPVPSLFVRRGVSKLTEQGVLLIAAAGNSGPRENTVGYPAGYEEVISVGAVDEAGRVARFSSRGRSVDVVAPGTNVLSTWLDDRYRRLDGTSMAAPHAAGIAALLWPRLGNALEVREALLSTAVPLDGDWPETAQGRGRVDAAAAYACAERRGAYREREGVPPWEGNSQDELHMNRHISGRRPGRGSVGLWRVSRRAARRPGVV